MFERELYKTAFGANPLPMVLTDFNGNILDASVGFALLFDVQRDDLIGLNLKEIMQIEIAEDLVIDTSIKGEFYKVISQKYEVEGIVFFVFSLYKIEQLRQSPSSSVIVNLRDLLQVSLEISTFPEFVATTFPTLCEIFGASSAILLRRSRTELSRFFIVYGTDESYKMLRDRIQIKVENESYLKVGMPIIINNEEQRWGSLKELVIEAGYVSGWAIPFGFEEDFVDSLCVLFFNELREPDSEEHNLLVFLSYYYSLVYQKSEFKKQYEALSYKDLISQTYSEVLIREMLDVQCEQAKRYGIDFSVLMIRVENYEKLVNIYGKYQVETTMSNIAKTLKENLRKADICGRLSNNSFVVLLPFTNSTGTDVVYQRVLNILRSGSFPPCKNVKFSASITTYMEGDNNTRIVERLKDLLRPVL
uniref:Diguanylate cyclase n=1 Tax=candidate division WOR-3 bacterium TaxID=2052148 RepID=A0A7C2K0K2_UNCW3